MFMVTTVIECKLVVQAQRRFMYGFRVDRIPSFDIILKWVENFMKLVDFFGIPAVFVIVLLEVHTVYTPGNVGRVREAAISSPPRFARHQSTVISFSDNFYELKFHLYKMQFVCNNCKTPVLSFEWLSAYTPSTS
jgi:hypothetical protein